jgi:hypothetical protein
MENKLATDGRAIGSLRDQFSYVFSRLEDSPRAMATTFASMGGHDSTYDPHAFMQYLVACYGDPNLKQRALGRLQLLTQGPKESFASFLPKFEKELADSGGAGWSSEVQINFLRGALNGDIEELLLAQTALPGDYRGFVNVVQQLGTNLDNRRFRARKRLVNLETRTPSHDQRRYQGPKPGIGAPANPDAMDWEPTKISRAAQQQNERLQGKRAKWVSQEEWRARRKEGRCLRCGRTGCQIAECPLLPPKRPSAQIGRTRPVTEAAVEEEDEKESLSWSDEEEEALKE